MGIVLGLAVEIGLPLAIIYVMHRWIGSYPQAPKMSVAPRREIAETAIFWTLAMDAMTYFVLSRDPADLREPSVSVRLRFIAWLIVPFLILPTVVLWRQGWRAPEFGFRRPTSKWMVVFALALFAFAGVLPMFGGSEPLAWSFLAIALYQPAFIEEFFSASSCKASWSAWSVRPALGSGAGFSSAWPTRQPISSARNSTLWAKAT